MKLLAELYADLSYEELSNLSLSVDGGGTIKEESRPKIVGYLNEGLLRLYARFVLKEQDVLIQMYDHITNYHLLKKYAQSQQEPEAEGYFYIQDLMGEPFEEDVIKILEVRNSLGWKYPLNDSGNPRSLYTPQNNVLQVPEPLHDSQISVMYQARHKPITIDDAQGENVTGIDLPDILYGALRAFIAYKVFSHMNTQESTAKSQEHLANYEAICMDAVEHDLVNTSIASTNTKFEQRGFV